MSLRSCALTPEIITGMAALAELPEWTADALDGVVDRTGWLPQRDSRSQADPDHTVVFAEPEFAGDHRWAYVSTALYYEPDPEDEPEDDELAQPSDAWNAWALNATADRAAFDAEWNAHRDAITAVLGRAPATTVTEPEFGWRAALWPCGEHALAFAQTEDFDSYSLFDMAALWVCRRPTTPPEPSPDDAYRWMREFPAILAAAGN
ncbi:hypothetical protein [Stackebrandtia soli]|uniref:hypothetical protein n=1 Tax=Stackebrandtia soli TaxID=1892856 RepID=UPI0039ED5D9B